MAYLCLQGCFLPGGALPTAPAGSTLSLVKAINTLRTAGCFDLTVFTQVGPGGRKASVNT